ncbi:MAG: SRPBCC family protein [Archangium sp.]
MATTSDRIEKRITLKAPLSRVWSAISDSQQFGQWFGVRFDGPFVAGKAMVGFITPTTVDAEIAKSQQPYTGKPFNVTIEAITAPTRFAFRWHPFAVDEKHDYSKEPTTLVEFVLQETKDGTQLTITESGFDQVPLERRAEAFKANDGGWAAQTQLIAKYLAQ